MPKYDITFGSAVVSAVARIDDAIPDTIMLINIKVLFLSVSTWFILILHSKVTVQSQTQKCFAFPRCGVSAK
jgi:hypothetical protein